MNYHFDKVMLYVKYQIKEAWGHISEDKSNLQVTILKRKICSIHRGWYRPALSTYTFLLTFEETLQTEANFHFLPTQPNTNFVLPFHTSQLT